MHDLRYILRGLVRRPGVSGPAVLILALSLGANLLVFSLVDSVFLRPLPYSQPDRLVMVWQTNAELQEMFGLEAFAEMNHSLPNFEDLTRRTTQLEQLTAFRYWRPTVGLEDYPTRVRAMQVTPGFFETFGVQPAIGTVFSDAVDSGEKLALVSHDFWQRDLGGDAGALRSELMIDGQPHTLLGIMPPGFDVPPRLESGSHWSTEVWTLLPTDSADRTVRDVYVMGRLRPAASMAAAESELQTMARQMAVEHPEANEGWSYRIEGRRDYLLADVLPILLLLFVAVTFVVLIASTNLVNLLLANLTRRGRDLQILGALGAPPHRLRRQLLGEALMLSVFGGLLGLLLAWVGVRILDPLLADLIPRGNEVALRLSAVGYGLLLAFLLGLLAGGLAVRHATKRGLSSNPTESMSLLPRSFDNPPRWLPGSIVLQTGLAFILLVGAGLLLHSFWRLTSVEAGFESDGVFTADLSLPPSRYSEKDSTVFFRELTERLQDLAEVEAVGAVQHLPLTGVASRTNATPEGGSDLASSEGLVVLVNPVTPGFLEALGVPIRAGRALRTGDGQGESAVMLINETAAELFWPDREPIGREVSLEIGTPPLTVVGVVADFRSIALSQRAEPAVFLPLELVPTSSMSLVVTTDLEDERLARRVRQVVSSLDPQLPVHLRPMQEVLAASIVQPRVRTLVLGIFALEALLLATVGLYGLLSFLTGLRRREIGIRLALGSSRRAVGGLVLRRSLLLTGIGIALGFVATFSLYRLITGFLFEVTPTDWVTHLGATALLLAVALGASLAPAYRATRVDPVLPLRGE